MSMPGYRTAAFRTPMGRTAAVMSAWLVTSCGPPPASESVDPLQAAPEPGAGERSAASLTPHAVSSTTDAPGTGAANTPEGMAAGATVGGSDGDSGRLGAAPAQPNTAAPHSAKVAAECTQLCQGAEGTCSRKSVRECRANCGKYQSLADRCEMQVLSAIRCQAAVPKLICSNLASECAQQFRELTACEHGVTPMRVESALSPPPDWERVEDPEGGFAIHLPRGASAGEFKGFRTWRAVTSKNAELLVAILPGIAGEPSEKRMMESVIHYLGHECQPAVRLHGRFETERDVAERFDAKCQDGRAWHGILRASLERVVLIAEVVTEQAQRIGDRYYYSFESLK